MTSIWPVLGGLFLLVLAFSLREMAVNHRIRLSVSAWGDVSENRILIDLISDFRLKHPKIQVELERFPFTDYSREVLSRISLGAGPDVIFTEASQFGSLFFADRLEPLDGFLHDASFHLSAYNPEVLGRFTVDGSLYVVPRDTALYFLVYYNHKYFDEEGMRYPHDDWNWDDFTQAARRLTKTDSSGKTVRWGVVEDHDRPEAWVASAGGSYADDIQHPTRWTFAEDPGVLDAVRFHADLIHRYKVMPPSSVSGIIGGVETEEMFANGSAAMFLTGLWKTPRFREIKAFSWDVVPFPHKPGRPPAFAAGGSGYGISKASKNKKTAWEFVKFISGEEGARKLAATGLAQPALMSVAQSPDFLDRKPPLNKKALLQAVRHVRYFPLCGSWQEVQEIIQPALTRVWKGLQTPEDALHGLKPLLQRNPPHGRRSASS